LLAKEINLKLAVYGEGAVGKTSLVKSYTGEDVPNEYSPTINSSVSRMNIFLKRADIVFKLNIWDVGGNRAINPTINNAFFTGVDLALIVFDLTRPELTLKNYEKNFLEKLKHYSEEPLTLIVGNKFDKLKLNSEFKKAVQNYLDEKKSFVITSATTNFNVKNCFELLFYTFLKRSEVLLPELVPEDSSSEFIETLGKTEKELREFLVNLSSISTKHQQLKPKIKLEKLPSKEVENEEKYHNFLQQELQKISSQKTALINNFFEELCKLQDNINQLRKQYLKFSSKLVDQLTDYLEHSKMDCEQSLKTLIRLTREENELQIVRSKSKIINSG
ncbi:MAG: GTP-binding protein, partial [Candidatus Thorarchaeota archaeon]